MYGTMGDSRMGNSRRSENDGSDEDDRYQRGRQRLFESRESSMENERRYQEMCKREHSLGSERFRSPGNRNTYSASDDRPRSSNGGQCVCMERRKLDFDRPRTAGNRIYPGYGNIICDQYRDLMYNFPDDGLICYSCRGRSSNRDRPSSPNYRENYWDTDDRCEEEDDKEEVEKSRCFSKERRKPWFRDQLPSYCADYERKPPSREPCLSESDTKFRSSERYRSPDNDRYRQSSNEYRYTDSDHRNQRERSQTREEYSSRNPRQYCVFYMTQSYDNPGKGVEVLVEELTKPQKAGQTGKQGNAR